MMKFLCLLEIANIYRGSNPEWMHSSGGFECETSARTAVEEGPVLGALKLKQENWRTAARFLAVKATRETEEGKRGSLVGLS